MIPSRTKGMGADIGSANRLIPSGTARLSHASAPQINLLQRLIVPGTKC
jgi:hypothetical protein